MVMWMPLYDDYINGWTPFWWEPGNPDGLRMCKNCKHWDLSSGYCFRLEIFSAGTDYCIFYEEMKKKESNPAEQFTCRICGKIVTLNEAGKEWSVHYAALSALEMCEECAREWREEEVE